MKNKILFLLFLFSSIKIFPSFEELIKKLDYFEDSLQIQIDSTLLSDYNEKTINYMIEKLNSSDWYFKNISIRVLKKVKDKESLLTRLQERKVDRIFIMKIFEDDPGFTLYNDLKIEDVKLYELNTYITFLEKRKKVNTIFEIINKNYNDYISVKALQSLNDAGLKDSFCRDEILKNKKIFENLISKKNLRINRSLSIIISNFFSDSLEKIFDLKQINDIPTFSLYIESAILSGKKIESGTIEKFYKKFRTKDFYYLDSIVKKYFQKFSKEELEEMKNNVENEFIKVIIEEVIGEKNG
ncbi:MAG: hypothetical protein ABIN00_03125 [candidate division WOR-3 bacterium]